MANGIVVIDKPEGWTSMDVCAKLRGFFHEKRVGHAGTLDPMATGVLPVFVGRATRAVEFAENGEKEYIAGLKLGLVTNTQDTTGEILERRPVSVTREQIEEALTLFRGPIQQIPPMYSAIKIGGKKLYELARKGREVERPPRNVRIERLELLEGGGEDYSLRVVCSKGTYIRTLCHDIGQRLGTGGCMSRLRRTVAAGFLLENAVTLEQVLSSENPESLLLPVDRYFVENGWEARAVIPAAGERRLRCGASALFSGEPGRYLAYSRSGEFLGLARCENGQITLSKSFFQAT